MSAYTHEQYQMLVEMLAKGVTSLKQNGEELTFRSLPEMLRLKTDMEKSLGLNPPSRHRYPTVVKG